MYMHTLYLINGIHKHNTRLGVLVGQKTVCELNQGIKITHYITLKRCANDMEIKPISIFVKENKLFSVIYKYSCSKSYN